MFPIRNLCPGDKIRCKNHVKLLFKECFSWKGQMLIRIYFKNLLSNMSITPVCECCHPISPLPPPPTIPQCRLQLLGGNRSCCIQTGLLGLGKMNTKNVNYFFIGAHQHCKFLMSRMSCSLRILGTILLWLLSHWWCCRPQKVF